MLTTSVNITTLNTAIIKTVLLLGCLFLCNINFSVSAAQVIPERDAVETKAKTTILLLGDSLSASFGMQQNQGWVHLLNQRFLQEKSAYTIVNASISGETTAGGLARLPSILTNNNIDYLLIELGGNDGLRGFPPSLISNNLLQMIELAKDKNIEVILMQIQILPNYGPRYNQLFINAFKQIAMQTQTPLMPFFMDNIAIDPKLMQADGIHPNVAAQTKIADFMQNQIQHRVYHKTLR